MVFFKQYLLTLTCIVIVVQVMPASAETDEELSRNYCKVILQCSGFKDTNSAIDGITNVNYLERIPYLLSGKAEPEIKNIMTDIGIPAANKETTVVFEKIIAIFVKNTGTFFNDDEKKAVANEIKDKDSYRKIAMNLSIKYRQFYGKEKNIETVKNGSKAPITFFCQEFMNSSNKKDIMKLFTTADILSLIGF
ncbi:uncharacterized protein LOC100302376 precursor [Acyrthosiphon pisum]|uniref:Uncharacterized protein n=1 Tax=Acyrthosiphon pisum TaxID=7029 RepID=C4WX05_ACYPI|nr:uncharacterized protein LOC100302376 precursor [Acyrthosiphon pisum]BAH72425.1 hypothetical protein [Acyrthosiphon pisum]|eukprot:NP_001156435.1 uncharacterized protein LOC100302376 precursor [Acyrthosiphon pisum]